MKEVARKLQPSRIEDLIKGIRDKITAQEVCKQKGEYNYIDLMEKKHGTMPTCIPVWKDSGHSVRERNHP